MRPKGPGSPSALQLVGWGATLAAAVLVPMVIGGVIDGAMGTGPAFLLLGLLLGVVAAVSAAYWRFKRYL